MTKVYLSSTYEDLKEYRDAVYRGLRQLGHEVIAMEDYVATLFAVDTTTKGKSRNASAWDPKWKTNFGGIDNPLPNGRRNFIPVGFIPKLNPFYVALPYNDVSRPTAKSEAKVVIPSFKEAFVAEGQSVCRDRWVAIRNTDGKVCYAQWSDCGPFTQDDWQYVFGNDKPIPHADSGAGLQIAPAVRDFLGINDKDVTDWKFVDFNDVPKGRWALYGSNNSFVVNRSLHPEVPVVTPVPGLPPTAPGPTIITRPSSPLLSAPASPPLE